MTFRQPTLPSPQELRSKSYHKGYMAADGTRVRFQAEDDWARQHLLDGDGLLPLFFDHLGKVDRAHETRLRGVFVPDTITFNNSFPRCWQYSDDGAEISKRPGRDLDARTIYDDFTERQDPSCDIVAEYHYVKGAQAAREQVKAGAGGLGASAAGFGSARSSSSSTARRGKGGANAPPDTCVEFLTRETLHAFLNSPNAKPDGILQRFVVPKGKTSSRHNFQLQAIWSPVVTLVYKRTNRKLLTDPTVGVAVRAPTFDGPPHLSTESLVAGSTLNRIDIVCRAIADHISQTEKKPVERLVAYFKEDDQDRIWLLWASSVRVGGDAWNPVRDRQPMNLALRVSTIRTVLPKAEAAKANAESVSEDASLLGCDVKLFDMTGDRDFARKCGGDLFPVSSARQQKQQQRRGGSLGSEAAAGDHAENSDDNGDGSFESKRRVVSGWSAGSGMTSQLQPTPPRGAPSSARKANSELAALSNSGGINGGVHPGGDTEQSFASTAEFGSPNAVNTSARSGAFSAQQQQHLQQHIGTYVSAVDGETRPILTPLQVLEKLERERMIAEGGNAASGTNAASASTIGGPRVSPPQSPRATQLNSDALSSATSARRAGGRPTSAARSAAGMSSSLQQQHQQSHHSDSGRVFISPRAPFLALNHPIHPPTLRDNSHPFHRAVERSEAKERREDAERNLSRDVGRSARKPPAAMVLLPGYREYVEEQRRRRTSFGTASRALEDTEMLRDMLERAALDVLYEAHSRSMASKDVIREPFAVPLPPLLATCLNEDELVSLCGEMRVSNAKFEAFGDSVRAVVYVDGGVLGRGTQVVGKGRPLVQIIDDVKECLRAMFRTHGSVLWDRYCGGAA